MKKVSTIIVLSLDLEHSLPHRCYRFRGAEQRGRQEVGLGGLVPGLWSLQRTRVLLKLSRLPGPKAQSQIRTNKEDESVGAFLLK